ncbi:predicted membrane-associated Zn-dependent protease 1 [Corynebacterium kutscheri]|uniref:Zinc metalloprotease Rip1 n=1 Tax=Corynebacterium kutscheri TaxID=35755 RepID=A0A0F6R281_9CORY|nr:site-2 protease family protein [Corynebacterium kutscheri]AKE41463.1 putative membrane-associated Zn-dependent protease [Corynebacterium kutscheri]VEH08741.1 predicted membrane-associated Zn-dependent protease 1 [Corynebacterium kutscheri]VEH09787.1 predicted membrane-associated Zn-dependent protease 1 [Corynebacterium kutscheri]VEH79870.1 predicted membrane-associated Zn-dependent protease 1 [Corynebacterium kutscheri]
MAAYLLGVFLFALGIAATIALHEAGHYTTARMFGMRVRRFFVGFGPIVWSMRKGHTVYGLKAIPVGGFCDIAGMTNQDEVTSEEEPHAMRTKPWWQRIIVLLGGIIVNVVVAVVIFYFLAISSGLPNPNVDTTPVVGELRCISSTAGQTCSGTGPAGEAGIQSGDRIVQLDGQSVESFVDVREYVLARPGKTIEFIVERGQEQFSIPVVVGHVEGIDSRGNVVTVGAVGLVGETPNYYQKYSPAQAIEASLQFTGTVVSATWDGLKAFPAKLPGVLAAVFGAERDVESPMSVVGASRVGGELVEHNMWSSFFMLLASLNLFLAMFNLVPLPPLDGGHIAVVIYEKIRDFIRRLRGLPAGEPADYRKLMPLTIGVAGLLVSVGVLVIIADVVNPVRLFG